MNRMINCELARCDNATDITGQVYTCYLCQSVHYINPFSINLSLNCRLENAIPKYSESTINVGIGGCDTGKGVCQRRLSSFKVNEVCRGHQSPFLSLAQSKLRLWSPNHRAGYFSNMACDWLSIVWAYSVQETENGPEFWISDNPHCPGRSPGSILRTWSNLTRSRGKWPQAQNTTWDEITYHFSNFNGSIMQTWRCNIY